MLPDGVVKGGSALKMRYGNAATCFTTDLDTAAATDPDLYAMSFGDALACSDGNVAAAADLLGLGKATLYRKLKNENPS